MINKNKEEIEKIEKGCKSIEWGCLPERLCPYCQRAKQERIKTSILWCEDEIEFLEQIDLRDCDSIEVIDERYSNERSDVDETWLDEYLRKRLEQLQSHLKWLKEKRGQDD